VRERVTVKTLMNPGGVAWRVQREAVILLGGRRALLMQIAHPAVAAAVAEHSDFKQDPFGRLRRTIEPMFRLAFGTAEQAEAAYRQVDSVHGRVRGVAAANVLTGGIPYNARDPELLMWVHATLVDTAMLVYRRMAGELGRRDAGQFYQESKVVARLFRIPERLIPSGLGEFQRYMRQMIEHGPVRVSATARELARSILYPPVPIVPSFAFDVLNIVTAGLLPAPLREQFGLKWSPARELLSDAAEAAIWMILPILPEVLRVVPAARAAERAMKHHELS
jgi:uncharacterized protein (DUF2236 family)